MISLTPTIYTQLTFGQRELRRPSLRDDVEQLEELVLFDSSRVDPKGRTYIDPGFTGINIIPNGPMLYIISQLKGKDLFHVAQVSRRFNMLTERHREFLYSSEDFDTLMDKRIICGTRSEICWMARCHPERRCSSKVFDWSSAMGHTEIVRLLIAENKPCSVAALDDASCHGHIEVVKLLLEAPHRSNGAIDNYPEGSSPYSDCTDWAIELASENGHIEVVKLLLEANKPCTYYALNWASNRGHIEIVRLLLAAGSPYSDCTVAALDWASSNGHIEVVKLLLEENKICTTWALGWLDVIRKEDVHRKYSIE